MNQSQLDAMFEEISAMPPHERLEFMADAERTRRIAGEPPPDSMLRQRVFAERIAARQEIAEMEARESERPARELNAYVNLTTELDRLPSDDEVTQRATADPELDALAERYNAMVEGGPRVSMVDAMRIYDAKAAGYFEVDE